MISFLQVFRFSQFSLEIPSAHLTIHCHKCLFHMDNHINQVRSVMIVERILRSSCTSFFGSWSEIFIFQTSFMTYKAQTNDMFFRYCDSSVESLRLSALGLVGAVVTLVALVSIVGLLDVFCLVFLVCLVGLVRLIVPVYLAALLPTED